MNVNLVNRFNRLDTQFRQPGIGRNNRHLRFGDDCSVAEHIGDLKILNLSKPSYFNVR
jgi:hypothetical protein